MLINKVALSFFMFISLAAYSATTQLRVQLDWYPSVEFAGLYVAQEKGWFKDEGIDIHLNFNDLEITDKVLTGQADIGMHSAHEVMRTVDQGRKIKAFAAHYQLNPLTLLANRAVKSLKDLKGKTVGYFSEQELDVIKIILNHHQITLSQVTLVKLNQFDIPYLTNLLRSGKVNAFLGWEFNFPVSFALSGYVVRQFPGYKNGFHFYGIVYFSKDEFIKTNYKLLRKFLQITKRGWLEFYKSPNQYTKLIVNKYYSRSRYLNDSKAMTLKHQQLQAQLSKRFIMEGIGIENYGNMSKVQWQASLDIAQRFGVIKNSREAGNFYSDLVLKGKM